MSETIKQTPMELGEEMPLSPYVVPIESMGGLPRKYKTDTGFVHVYPNGARVATNFSEARMTVDELCRKGGQLQRLVARITARQAREGFFNSGQPEAQK